MRLLSLSLRGAIGTKSKLGMDQVNIDFTRFDPGVIAFVGGNGLGKSTILESLHPYRTLAQRTGALQNHFYLRDSHRILRFEMSGHEYECRLLIDAQTGKQEAYLYCDGAPLTDGKTTTYDAAVTRLFGSEDLFFRSLFRAQNAAPFASLPTAMRKKLFVELLGLSRLEEYHAAAKVRRDEADAALERIRARIAEFDGTPDPAAIDSEIAALRVTQASAARALAACESELTAARAAAAALESDALRITALEAAARDADAAHRAAEAAVTRAETDARTHEQAHEQARADAEKRLARERKIESNAETIRARVADIARLEAALEAHESARRAHDAATEQVRVAERERDRRYDEADRDLRAASDAVARATRAIADWTTERDHTLATLRRDLASARRRAELMCGVPCSSHPDMQSSCALLADARTATAEADALELRIAAADIPVPHDLEDVLGSAYGDELRAKARRDSIDTSDVERAEARVRASGYDAAAHDADLTALSALKADRWDELARELAAAESTIAAIEAQITEADARFRDILAEDTERIREANEARIEASRRAHAAARNLGEARDRIADLPAIRARIEVAESNVGLARSECEDTARAIARLEASRDLARDAWERRTALEAEAAALETEAREWTMLARATGRDGIQALELDAAGPNVAAIANQLLSDAYGSSYQIAFETTRMSADGKRQIESFEIAVDHDGKRGRIEDLSGGQRVWIEAAISQAIAIYLRRKSGLDLRTTFLDEADGALDAENAHRYLTMLRRSHDVAGTHHTLIITHRQELLSLIPAQIHLVPGEGVRVEA